jgi:hypothetical protein
MENPVEGHSYMGMRMYTVRYSTGRRNCNRNILNDHEFAEDFTAQADTTTFTLPQTKFAAAGSTCISHTQQSTCLHPHLRTQTDPLPETSCSPAFLNTGLSTRSQNPVILSGVYVIIRAGLNLLHKTDLISVSTDEDVSENDAQRL